MKIVLLHTRTHTHMCVCVLTSELGVPPLAKELVCPWTLVISPTYGQYPPKVAADCEKDCDEICIVTVRTK